MENDFENLKRAATEKIYYAENEFRNGELIRSYYHFLENFGDIGPHSHNFYELNVIIKGKGTHYIQNKSYKIQEGMAFLIPPYAPHGYTFDNNDYVIFHILFHNLFFDKYNHLLKNVNGFNLFFEIEPHIRLHSERTTFLFSLNSSDFTELISNFKRLVQLESESNCNTQLEKEFLALYIISVLCDSLSTSIYDSNKNDEFLLSCLKVAEYIQNNFYDKITISQLCALVNMSRSSLLRYFARIYNCSPLEYLNDYRINQSKIMLCDNSKNIATIAQDSGFFDSSHFIHFFTKKVGISPAKYRENIFKNK